MPSNSTTPRTPKKRRAYEPPTLKRYEQSEAARLESALTHATRRGSARVLQTTGTR